MSNARKHMTNFLNVKPAVSGNLRAIRGVLTKACLILVAGICASQASAQGTYKAASCNMTDVAAAIAAEQAHAVDGDIISIPSCPAGVTWTGAPLQQTFHNSVTIQGAGAQYSTTAGASIAGTDSTVLINGMGVGNGLLYLTTVAGKSLRVTGIYFESPNVVAYAGVLEVAGTSSAVRVDHCHVYINGEEGIFISGSVTGVADHNFFQSDPNQITNDYGFHNGDGWNGTPTSAVAKGDGSWADTEHWGTNAFFFVEDNYFQNGDINDAHDGARYVVRYSSYQTVGNSSCSGSGSACNGQFYNHGVTDAPARGTRAAEVYMNNFSQPVQALNPSYGLESGTLLYWGNIVTNYKNAVTISYNFRNQAGGGGNYQYLPAPNGWGFCGSAAGGPTNWDGNLNTTSGFACLDQPGRGAGQLLNGQEFPNRLNTATGTIAWPKQALSPIYVWGNTYKSTYPLVANGSSASGGYLVANNTDYYEQFGNGANTGTFNGTVGVGEGLLSARPSTCSAGTDPMTGASAPGVGYWATDTNTLYVCNPTNNWTNYYTPYTYPHPLTAGTTAGGSNPPNPPSGLAANVN